MLNFILGGARSGKSRFAENLATEQEAQGQTVFYIATAQRERRNEQGEKTVDKEMAQRIAQHQSDRPDHWQTLESPLQLSKTLRSLDKPNHCILVDCLTLWTLNVLEADCFEDEKHALLTTLPTLTAEVILVSNEVGMGIVPLGEFTRQYVDELGRLHQELGTLSDKMAFIIAGQPLWFKQSLTRPGQTQL